MCYSDSPRNLNGMKQMIPRLCDSNLPEAIAPAEGHVQIHSCHGLLDSIQAERKPSVFVPIKRLTRCLHPVAGLGPRSALLFMLEF